MVDGEAVPHRIVLTITDMTKVIDGVQSVVAYDEDYSDGELVEAEIFFLAQDNDGNVWRMGEYPEEYEAGDFVDAPTWLAGVQGSLAGYWMTADPAARRSQLRPGLGTRGRLGRPGEGARGWCPRLRASRRYDDVLVVEEWALDEPDARQLKSYASGVGNIRVAWSESAEQEQEVLELTEFGQLSSDALAEVRAAALAPEAHAYEIRPEVSATPSRCRLEAERPAR